MPDSLNAYPFIITTAPIEVQDAKVGFDNTAGLDKARVYSGGGAITWQTFTWSNIPAESLNDWLFDASELPASTTLIELSPENFITAGGLISEGSDGSQAALSVNIDTAANDLFVDYLIYFDKEVPSSLTVTHTGTLYSAVRSTDPTLDDYTIFTAHNDATRLSELQALADGKKALHIYAEGVGTGSAAFDIPDVKVFNHYDHRDNRTAMPYLQGNGQDFNGLTQYDQILNFQQLDFFNDPILINLSFYADALGGIVFSTANQNILNKGFFYVQIVGGQIRLDVREWIGGALLLSGPTYTTSEALKVGYNNLIVKWNGVYTGAPLSTDCEIYINGKKCTVNLSTSPAGGALNTGIFAAAIPCNIACYDNNGTNIAFFDGKIKTLQYIDTTGETITDAKIKAIAEQHDARNVLTNSTYELDVDFAGTPTDRGANTYAITPFNGLTQNNYL